MKIIHLEFRYHFLISCNRNLFEVYISYGLSEVTIFKDENLASIIDIKSFIIYTYHSKLEELYIYGILT